MVHYISLMQYMLQRGQMLYPQTVVPLAKGRIAVCCMPPVVVLIYQLNQELITIEHDLTCSSFS